MNRFVFTAAAMLVSGCATQERAVTQDEEQAVRDYVLVRGLEEVKRMRSSDRDSWDVLDEYFIIYETRRNAYLVEFKRACYELNESRVTPDLRREANTIRARSDTIRGCLVDKIFALTEADVAELKALGETPGSRN
jgi:hypothetical protein